jgi:hypothetical protein
MARANLLTKLFSSFSSNDREGFVKTANETIGGEQKTGRVTLANGLRAALSSKPAFAIKGVQTFAAPQNNGGGGGADLFEVIRPDKALADTVLAEENRAKIRQVPGEFSNWDALAAYGVWPARRLLFYGPPGRGKTVTAGAMAAELGLPLPRVRFDGAVSPCLGKTAANIRKAFGFASGGRCVMLFGEFGAIAGSRSDWHEHGEMKRVANTLLTADRQFQRAPSGCGRDEF